MRNLFLCNKFKYLEKQQILKEHPSVMFFLSNDWFYEEKIFAEVNSGA